MRNLCRFSGRLAFAVFVFTAASAFAAESGRIVSASPSAFSCGQAITVTVQVQNTGDSDDMFIEADSWPSGWSVTPKNVNPNLPSSLTNRINRVLQTRE